MGTLTKLFLYSTRQYKSSIMFATDLPKKIVISKTISLYIKCTKDFKSRAVIERLSLQCIMHFIGDFKIRTKSLNNHVVGMSSTRVAH